MAYGNLTPISITATVQSYTASARLSLPGSACLNAGTPVVSNVQVTQVNQAPQTQTDTGTTVSFWFAFSGTLSYVPVGGSCQKQVPFRFLVPPISFTGTAGQTPTVAPTLEPAQIVNAIVNNNCVKAATVVIPVTFTASYPAA